MRVPLDLGDRGVSASRGEGWTPSDRHLCSVHALKQLLMARWASVSSVEQHLAGWGGHDVLLCQ